MSGSRVVLSDQLLKSDSLLKTLCANWLREFNTKPATACEYLFELIMHSSGYKAKQPLSKEDFTVLQMMNADNFENMVGRLELRPLVTDRRFLRNLTIFFEITLTERVLSNEEFMKKITSLLKMMLQSKWKAVRYTVSVIIYNIIQCTVKVKFTMPKPCTSSSLESLSPSTEDILENITPYMEIMAVCLLDVSLRGRKNSTELYWKLLMEFPTLFLSMVYLRNMFWALFDESYTIRMFSTKAFGTLAERRDLADHVDIWYDVTEVLFMRTEDTNEQVAVEALNSLKHIYKIITGLFKWNKIMKIVFLIFIEKNRVNSAAASFLNLILESLPGQDFFKKLFQCLDAFEDEYMVESDAKFIDVFLPVAQKTFHNWQLWSDLIVSDDFSHRHKIRICNFLTQVMEKSTLFKGETCDHFPEEQVAGLNQAEKIDYYARKFQLKSISNQFVNSFPTMWECYKDDETCLKYLVKIPKYCNIEEMKPDEVYSYLVSLKCVSETCIDEIYSVLSHLLQKMKLSAKWYDSVPLMKRTIIDSVGRQFSKSCQKIAASPINPVSKWSIVLRKALKLAKHFDLTETGFNIQAFEALKFGMDNENPQIIKTSLHMCSFIVEKQVTYIASGNNFVHDLHLQEYLQNLATNLKKLMPLLGALLATNNHSIRIQVYTVLCKIYLLFSPQSEFVKRFPQFNRPKPSLIVVEWLNYVFHQLSEKKNEVNDDESYYTIKSALQNFCLLLTAEVIPLLYISTVLPFFSCYSRGMYGNYNSVLQPALEKLFEIPGSIVVFLKALEVCCKEHSIEETEEIAEGIINIYILKMHSHARAQSLSAQIVGEGVRFHSEYFPLLHILSRFIRLMSPVHASYLVPVVLRGYKFSLDDNYVKKFIIDLKQRGGRRRQLSNSSTTLSPDFTMEDPLPLE